jgi:type I restriction enzyme S subunit
LPSGNFPVIDQGQTKIAGWTNDKSAVIKGNIPLIIFGDHTRVFKYIDFPFAIGADGTKLIKPDEDEFCSRYFYYYLMSLNLPSKGYSRHYNLLKESKISYSEIPEQQKIAAVLFKIQQAIEAQESIIEAAQELKKSTMQHVFTYGLRGEKTKETEVGRIPESWGIQHLCQEATIATGGTPLRNMSAYWKNGTIPWVKTSEIHYNLITSTEEHITEAGFKNSAAQMLPIGTILMAMYGQGVTRGRVALLGIEATTNQACAAIQPNDNTHSGFLYYYLTMSYEKLRLLGHGAQQPNLNTQIINSFKIVLPKIDEQKQIADILKVIDNKIEIHLAEKNTLQDLFKTMLNKLMTGEVRVQHADIDTSCVLEMKNRG